MGRTYLPALHLLLVATTFLFRIAIAADTIYQTASITGNQTLVSAGGVFRLGFFSPTGAADGPYLGIWYASIPEQTVVWVANSDKPLVNTPGTVILSTDGRLVILDHHNTSVWSSAAPTRNMTPGSTARLLDSGNLVVSSDGSNSPESVAWQSFDYPTDTLLPGMKLGVDIKSGITRNITSWNNPTDPSPGHYTFALVLGGLPEFFLFQGLTKLYASGPWNGEVLTGVSDLKQHGDQGFLNFTVVSSPEETYYSYSILDRSLLSRFIVNGTTGKLQRFWSNNSSWNKYWDYPNDRCDTYAACGPFGYCVDGAVDQSKQCNCLPGFEPRSTRQWSLMDWFEGCVRTTNLTCGDGDGFWKVNKMKLPDATNATVHAGMTLDQCRQECLSNCRCVAYAAANVDGGVSRGCVIWAVDLVDMREYPSIVQDVFLRLAQSDVDALNATAKGRSLNKTVLIALVAAICGVGLLGAVGCCCFLRRKVRRKGLTEMDDVIPLRVRRSHAFGPGRAQPMDENTETEDDLDLPMFDLEGVGEFKNEVKLIAKLQHRNLVRLLGCCIEDDERLLVYEYMHNSSLDTFIFDESKRKLLSWNKRFEIILGIARGLLYLHEDSRFRIIHRDLKASNILLDTNMVPKVSDFGIARMFEGDQTTAYTIKVMGTFGYMSPEYAMDGVFSMKSDVFSFGVLVLEIISGRRNRGFCESELNLNLLRYAWMLWKEGRSVNLLDELTGGIFDYIEVLRCIHVALLCVEVQPKNRPLMSSVVMMLCSENATLPEPNEPGVYIVKNTSDTESSQSLTGNNLTITTLEARGARAADWRNPRLQASYKGRPCRMHQPTALRRRLATRGAPQVCLPPPPPTTATPLGLDNWTREESSWATGPYTITRGPISNN
uniref:Receptor-like serine/threonine-protein kinase n=2 Tax=Leersia perrieri TaxID=77586 RepID=A0A0D9V6J9_9ORYZ